ncbi:MULTISPECIES: PadR family transcriptional regulator [Franconibacter]|uniref:PadR family transcriptional regulator n=1 Tax=Franconibacter daqui TaxID=2047724 RepID=A0ABV1PJW9_9ENTR|nr:MULTISPECIES: PadR family transcriptional regulator [Franconibacter]GGD22686.1 PadR family transcriptional regulator [Franconibacter daqui]
MRHFHRYHDLHSDAHGMRRNHHGHGHHEEGHARRPRFFGHGELRLVMLDILTRGASHGYELIKEIEALTGGNYTPSPGVIYPTLDFLQEQQFISLSEEESGRKKIVITEAGTAWLEENSDHLAHIHARVKARIIGHELRKNPEMKRALENLKAVLDLKVNQAPIEPTLLKKIVGIIDKAALEISQLD